MIRRLLSLSLVACFAAACVPAATDADADADLEDEGGAQSGVEVWSGLGLQGIHDAPFNDELLQLFPKGGGWGIHTLYSTDYDWIGNVGSETSWAKSHGFSPILRVDYARPEGSTFADGKPALGASVPMPGDVGYCLARKDGPSRNAGGKHLDCYLAFLADLVPSTPDVHNWIIGNEMNMILEAKGHPGGKIDPSWYGQVYRAARNKIHSYPGHESDAVFVAGVAPGADGGGRYQTGKSYLTQMLYALSPNEVDGIAMHAYGGWAKDCDNGGRTAMLGFEEGAEGGMGYKAQARWIDALGYSHTPLLLTEMSVNMHVESGKPNPLCGDMEAYLYDRKEASNFVRDAYKSIYEWNQGPNNHDILGGIWFTYDSDDFKTESLKRMRDLIAKADVNPSTSADDNPYYAFRELAEKGTYAHGDPNGFGECSKSSDGDALVLDKDPYTMSGKIRDSWKANGGLDVFGYPIQGASCQADASGRVLYSQFTQRARLEYHPELAGTPYEVSFGLIGRPLASASGVNTDAWSNQSAAHGGDCEWIGVNAGTGHYVCGAILKHYKSHGVSDPSLSAADRSLRLFGLPISEPVQQNGITVQWFERARLELHPENAEPYNVLGGLIGCEASGITGFGCAK